MTGPSVYMKFCEESVFYLLVESKTGIFYSSQTGGVCCNHPQIEGAIIAAAPATIFGIMVDLGDIDRDSARDAADFALATLQWSSFTKVIDCKIDPSRRSEEGWWSVTFYLQSPLKDEKVGPFRGVIFGPNSD